MARHGVAMAAARRGLLRRLSDRVEGGVGPFPGARLGFKPGLETQLGEGSALDVEDRFRRALFDARARDGMLGQTTTGAASLRSRRLSCGPWARGGAVLDG